MNSATLEKLADLPPARSANIVIGASLLGALVGLSLSMPLLTPILLSLPVLPFFYYSMKKGAPRAAFHLLVRWAIGVFILVAILSGFFPDRMAHALPGSRAMSASFIEWVSGGPAPLGFGEMLLWAAGLTAASFASGGLAGLLVLSGFLSIVASTFMLLMRYGDNIFHMAAIGVPPWILLFAIFAIAAVVPASAPFYARVFNVEYGGKERQAARFHGRLALVALLLALLLYPMLGRIWASLLEGCTLLP